MLCYDRAMKEKTIVLGVLVVIALGLGSWGVYKFTHSPHSLSMSQAIAQRNTALYDLQVQKELNSVNNTAANNQIASLKITNATLTSQKATLCNQIKTAKFTQVLCQ